VLRQRSRSAVVIVAVALIPALLGHPAFSAALALLAVLGALEFYRAVGLTEGRLRLFGAAAAGATVLLVGFEAQPVWIAALGTGLILGPLLAGVFTADHEQAIGDWVNTLAGAAYVGVPLAHGTLIRRMDGEVTAGWVSGVTGWLGEPATAGFAWLVLVVASTWLTDTAAYLVGRQWGRTKLAPALSPAKSWEGAIAGVVAGAVTGVATIALLGIPVPLYAGAGLGMLISIAAQFGDLSESLIKRSLGIKDMGASIPGHGGILDRIDALLFTLPVGYYVIRVLLEIQWP
jgi:phosphatidate cytidylyltransferase